MALDIGTEFAKALIFQLDQGRVEVRGYTLRRQLPGAMESGAILDIRKVTEVCNQAIGEAAKRARGLSRRVILGLAGELVKGRTSRFTVERADPEKPIDIQELKNILYGGQRQALGEAKRILEKETGSEEMAIRFLDVSPLEFKIDGLPVQNPLGFQGQKVTFSVYNSFAPLVNLGALQSVAEGLKLEIINIVALPFALADSFAGKEVEAIVLDVGGGTTDLAIIKNGSVVASSSFALGGKSFTKRLAEEAGLELEEAEVLKQSYGAGESVTNLSSVKRSLRETAQIWLSAIQLTLAEHTQFDPLPSTFLLCGGGALLPNIKRSLQGKTWYKDLPFAAKPQVILLKPTEIKKAFDPQGLLQGSQDVTPLSLACNVFSLVEGEVVQELLRRSLEILS